jgi:hypothetical protein
MKPAPLRHLIAIGIAAMCIVLAISNHYAEIARQNAGSDFMFETPFPPDGVFLEGALVFPGLISGSPLIIAGAEHDSEWLLESGQILGAIFFWYCVGWWVDCVRGSVERDMPPTFVLIHLRALRVMSVVLFPLGLIEGMRVGEEGWCANGKPPFLAELLIYGIGMAWISAGTWFAWENFRESRRASVSHFIFSDPSA